LADNMPVTCQLCGEPFPDKDAIWDHECPEWDRIRRTAMPTLAAYRNLIHWYENAPGPRWAKRLIMWGVRQAVPEREDPELIDALLKLRPRQVFRMERRRARWGLIDTGARDDLDKARRQFEIETELEGRADDDWHAARRTVDGRRRRKRLRSIQGGRQE